MDAFIRHFISKLLLLVTSIFFLFETCLAQMSVNLTDEEKLWISEHPLISATNELDWAPIDFNQNGMASGLSVDYLNLVAQKTGLKINYISNYTWSELNTMVRDKEIDVIHSLGKSKDRDKYLIYTDPYLELPLVYFGRSDAPEINNIADLQGKRIGIIKGAAHAQYFHDNHSDLNLIEYASSKLALIALSNEEIDVFPGQTPIINYLLSKNLILGIKIIGLQKFSDRDSIDKFRIATHKDNPILIDIINKGISAISEQEFLAITKKWQANYLESFQKDIGLSPEEKRWLLQNKDFKVVIDPTTTPIDFISTNGALSGISGSYLDKIGKILNINFEWVGNNNLSEGLRKIKSGQADILTGNSYLPEREEFIDFTNAFLTLSFVIFAHEEGQVYGSMEGLIGKKIAQLKNSDVTRKIRKDFPDIELIEVDTSLEALKLISNGEVDAYVATIPDTSYNINSGGFTNIAIVGETPYLSFLSIGVRSDYKLLISSIQKALSTITPQEKAIISSTWLSLPVLQKQDLTFIRNIIIVSIIVMIVILIWNYSLRREVERRKVVEAELMKSRLEAEEANKAKSSFLANMSHEIRTPLNAIIGFSDAITSGLFGEVSIPKHKEYLNNIQESGKHLSAVIKDILDLSKIEAGKWDLNETEFQLDECIESAINILKPLAFEKNITISYTNDPAIILYAELYAIKRALINLLSNAVKFTHNNGEIKCNTVKNKNGTIIITIKDNGIGIPAERLEHVLKPFGQNPEVIDSNEVGTGLGLSIAQQLIDIHGGKFSLTSEIGCGTLATITLPKNRVIS